MQTKKFILFGDSLFANFGKDLIQTLESKLPEYDVYNLAVGGWDTNDCLKKSSYIATFEPDIVAISLGTNDAAPWKQVPLEKFKDNIEKMLKILSKSRIVFFLPPPVDETKGTQVKDRTNKVMKKYHDRAKKICLKNGASIIDSWAIFMPLMEMSKDYHIGHGVHLNDLGYEVLIDKMAEVVKKI